MKACCLGGGAHYLPDEFGRQNCPTLSEMFWATSCPYLVYCIHSSADTLSRYPHCITFEPNFPADTFWHMLQDTTPCSILSLNSQSTSLRCISIPWPPTLKTLSGCVHTIYLTRASTQDGMKAIFFSCFCSPDTGTPYGQGSRQREGQGAGSLTVQAWQRSQSSALATPSPCLHHLELSAPYHPTNCCWLHITIWSLWVYEISLHFLPLFKAI